MGTKKTNFAVTLLLALCVTTTTTTATATTTTTTTITAPAAAAVALNGETSSTFGGSTGVLVATAAVNLTGASPGNSPDQGYISDPLPLGNHTTSALGGEDGSVLELTEEGLLGDTGQSVKQQRNRKHIRKGKREKKGKKSRNKKKDGKKSMSKKEGWKSENKNKEGKKNKNKEGMKNKNKEGKKNKNKEDRKSKSKRNKKKKNRENQEDVDDQGADLTNSTELGNQTMSSRCSQRRMTLKKQEIKINLMLKVNRNLCPDITWERTEKGGKRKKSRGQNGERTRNKGQKKRKRKHRTRGTETAGEGGENDSTGPSEETEGGAGESESLTSGGPVITAGPHHLGEARHSTGLGTQALTCSQRKSQIQIEKKKMRKMSRKWKRRCETSKARRNLINMPLSLTTNQTEDVM